MGDLAWIAEHVSAADDQVATFSRIMSHLKYPRFVDEVRDALRGHWIQSPGDIDFVLRHRRAKRDGTPFALNLSEEDFLRSEKELAQGFFQSLWDKGNSRPGHATRDLFLKAEADNEPLIALYLKAASIRAKEPISKVSDVKLQPSDSDYIDAYKGSLKPLGLSSDQAIDIGVPIQRDEYSPIEWIEYGQALPHGYRRAGNIGTLDFLVGLSNGYMAIGAFRSMVTLGMHFNSHSIAQHDAGHLAGFLASPEYMINARKIAKRVVEEFRASGRKFEDHEFQRWAGRAYIDRMDQIFETFAVFREESIPEIAGFAPKLQGTASPSLEFFYERLFEQDPKENEDYFWEVESRYPRWRIPLGGAHADLYTLNSSTPYDHDTPIHSEFTGAHKALTRFRSDPSDEEARKKWLMSLAKIQLLLYRAAHEPFKSVSERMNDLFQKRHDILQSP